MRHSGNQKRRDHLTSSTTAPADKSVSRRMQVPDAGATDSANVMMDVRECLRNIVCEVQLRAELGTGYFEPLHCYVSRPQRPTCKFGAGCTARGGFHWLRWHHSNDHPLLQLSGQERASLTVPWELATIKDCRHFVRDGRCLYGDACAFVHPTSPALPVQAQLDSPLPWDDPVKTTKSAPAKQERQRRRRPDKHAATAAFRRFLIDAFTTAGLAQGAGVLDVAGGAGVLSYELVNLNGVTCTIIDPRKPKFEAAIRRVAHRKVQLTQAPSLQHYDPASSNSSPSATGDKFPAWSSEWFGRWLFEDGVERPPEARRDTWLEKLQANGSACTLADEQAQILTAGKKLDRVMSECSVVIGLHPDSATEAIVDYALARDKPFAVVPCCVFCKLFPGRRAPDGQAVRSYAQFLDYLQAKSPSIQRKELDFVGRNVVLWHCGGAMQ